MGLIATAIYGVRNYGKVNNGDIGRLPAAVAQTTNSAGQAVNGVLNQVENLGRWADLGKNAGEIATKVSGLASKVTNPLLVGAAGVRIIRDDDKESALVEETAAMTGMFAAERMYKIVRNTVKQAKGDVLKEGKTKLFKEASTLGKIEAFSNKLDTYVLKNSGLASKLESVGKKIAELSKGKQKALFIAAELGLVATSIISYSLCKKLGKKLTGRDEEQQNVEETPVVNAQTVNQNAQYQKPAFTSLTVQQQLAAAQPCAQIY